MAQRIGCGLGQPPFIFRQIRRQLVVFLRLVQPRDDVQVLAEIVAELAGRVHVYAQFAVARVLHAEQLVLRLQFDGLRHLVGGQVDEVIKPEQIAQKDDEQHDADFPHAAGQHDGGGPRRNPDENDRQKQRRGEQRPPDGR